MDKKKYTDRLKAATEKTGLKDAIRTAVGKSNGEDIVLRAVMKPIPTQKKPLSTVDIHTKEKINSWVERGDTTAVPSCCVVAESMVALIVSNEIKKKFGGDSWEELKSNYFRYLERIENL